MLLGNIFSFFLLLQLTLVFLTHPNCGDGSPKTQSMLFGTATSFSVSSLLLGTRKIKLLSGRIF